MKAWVLIAVMQGFSPHVDIVPMGGFDKQADCAAEARSLQATKIRINWNGMLDTYCIPTKEL